MIVSLLTLGNLVPLEIFVLWPDCEVHYREWNNASVGYSWMDQELSLFLKTLISNNMKRLAPKAPHISYVTGKCKLLSSRLEPEVDQIFRKL